jgi:hypothetical protein
MKKLFVLFFICPIIIGCTTPKTVLKNESTGQVAICGGSAVGSMSGGVIGYHIEKSNDSDCVSDYTAEGFQIINSTK